MAPIATDYPTFERMNRKRELNSEKSFTLPEIEKHNTPEDCWLIIDGNVYNVTSWVPKHPGGDLIYVNAGKECSKLFDSYHPLHVRKMLEKFYIGVVDNDSIVNNMHDSKFKFVNFSCKNKERDFELTLKERVENYFKKNKLNPRVHPHMYIKAFAIITGYIFSYYFTFYFTKNLFFSFISSFFLGMFTSQVGISIQHDCNHGAFSKFKSLSYFFGISLDLVGASSYMWKQQHVVGHHVSTNINNFDPDIRVKDPDVRRVTSSQPVQWYHSYQHIYLSLLYGLLALKSVFLDDFSAYFAGEIGPVKLSKMTFSEKVTFWSCKAFYTVYMFGFTLLFGVHDLKNTISLYLFSQVITGYFLALMFQVAHVVEEANFPEAKISTNGKYQVERGWYSLQAATSTNFSLDSFFWLHFSGGLNHQIEHHLFPSICHVYYPHIQKMVESTCKEFDVPYHAFPSFWSALSAHFAYLKKVGSAGFELRLHG